jgi:hypothetical protein
MVSGANRGTNFDSVGFAEVISLKKWVVINGIKLEKKQRKRRRV